MEQTAFTKELFDFLDEKVADFRSREHQKQMDEMKKRQSEIQNKKPVKR